MARYNGHSEIVNSEMLKAKYSVEEIEYLALKQLSDQAYRTAQHKKYNKTRNEWARLGKAIATGEKGYTDAQGTRVDMSK